MKASKFTFFLLFFIGSIIITECQAQDTNTYPLWNGIESGEYNVGFRVIDYWDKSRNVVPKYGENGEVNEDRFFPIQISVWYPTDQNWNADKGMPFKEYFYLTGAKNDFKRPAGETKEKAMDIFFNFTNYGAKIELTKEQLSEIGKESSAALKDAQPNRETFPVIIAGHDGGVWKGTTLNEFLASHGFVVISTGLLSQSSSMIGSNPQAVLQRRIRTFELIRKMLPDFDFADESRIGLLGMNADGMTAILYQMKNGEADVVVNIDGWDGKNNGGCFVSNSIYFNPESFTIPFLEFHQHEETDREPLQLNKTIFGSLKSLDKSSYVITDFGHAYLTGNTIAVPNLDKSVVEKYQFMFSKILDVFNSNLKSGISSDLQNTDKSDSFFRRKIEN